MSFCLKLHLEEKKTNKTNIEIMMKSIKNRFLKKFKTIPSIYSSKQQNASSLCCQNLPNYMQQDEQDQFESRLYTDLLITSPCSLEASNEIDVFEECESELDTLPEMVSSSSTSSSCCASPTRVMCRSNENKDERTRSLTDFDEKCPPGGSEKVIVYTTSIRGVRKTYDNCQAMKTLLDSLRIVYIERDVSMDAEFRDEFWMVVGDRSMPPRLFIRGRDIGGVDEVCRLHEFGSLKKLLHGIPVIDPATSPCKCRQCGGMRFLVCLECNGSRKIYKGNGRNVVFGKCSDCNQNGLINCPTCSC